MNRPAGRSWSFRPISTAMASFHKTLSIYVRSVSLSPRSIGASPSFASVKPSPKHVRWA